MNRRRALLIPTLALPLLRADSQTPEAPIPPRIIIVHQGETNTIHCAELMDCSIKAPDGEKFVRRSIGDDAHFPDSGDALKAAPSPFYSFKPGFSGFRTSLHLYTDHNDEYSFLILDPGKRGVSDLTVILKSGDPAIDKRIADLPSVVPREDMEREKLHAQAVEAENAKLKAETGKKVQEASETSTKQLESKVHTYQFDHKEAKRRPWEIADIYRIGDFVYIRRTTDAQDLPVVVVKGANGKPEIIVPRYNPDMGLFTIAQRVNDGYFSFGGQKHEKQLPFHLPEGS
jgi:hypothetical protein